MGIYYHLTNDTKKQEVHLDCHVKYGPVSSSEAVHYALVNYMLDNLGDVMRMLPDNGSEPDGYDDVDLLKYRFNNDLVIHEIVRKLNVVYGRRRYKVVDGVGVDLHPD